ncbi:PorP/SprF family type IX secretion system membrane protein [Pedobacter punctiformis]|uniref:Type IX secretion system membrane protein PorP/SprF n=1 Tax=Pedobacter punctiformis TaxID=3004097 RepID=A0ABT4L6H9_9SPHI|nr:type IX secretion system membrane protein PorP/SprF [Pedobacter sp. HCMS5-2]MCZ4243525.1 type IX secretion system membrane protein PorP/SprF [Pedobacter sp. HCMS5-2]
MKKTKYIMIAIGILLMSKTYGQLNPMGSMYYQNQYLANPAMAGVEQGWELNGSYKAQWTAINGAPSMQAVTAAYGAPNKNVGIGINFYNESAGVIRRTSIKGTYAYHIALNNKTSFIDFGLSAGVMDEWVDFNRVVGDLGDQSLYNFNQRKLYFDGDFGVAFRTQQLTVQGSLPNLKRLFDRDLQRNVADRFLYLGAVSYKIYNESGAVSVIEPKFMYRGVENYKDIIDLGAQVQFWGDKLIMNGMYHSTNSVTIGAGTVYKNQLSILCQYTTNTSDLQTYSNGEFEIGLKYNFR